MTIQTQAVHFSADKKLIEFIERRMEKLDQFFDRILSAEVILKLENSGRIKSKIAEIKLNIPGTVLFVKENAMSFEASIDSAIMALRKQLIKYKERLRTKG